MLAASRFSKMLERHVLVVSSAWVAHHQPYREVHFPRETGMFENWRVPFLQKLQLAKLGNPDVFQNFGTWETNKQRELHMCKSLHSTCAVSQVFLNSPILWKRPAQIRASVAHSGAAKTDLRLACLYWCKKYDNARAATLCAAQPFSLFPNPFNRPIISQLPWPRHSSWESLPSRRPPKSVAPLPRAYPDTPGYPTQSLPRHPPGPHQSHSPSTTALCRRWQ